MCGFGGIVHWDGQAVLTEDLHRMACLLYHRGPDELCAAHPAEGVGLSHSRLRVIDLSDAARQPMANREKTVWIVYNGEIYNFRQLRAELEAAGSHFQSQSDTEIVLRAYEAWGAEGIPRLDGMFAFCIWDSRRRELLLARDRTGKKPLFYWTDGRCIVFGSEIKALLVHGHVPRRLNEAVLPFLLAFGYPPQGETCYEEIRQLPPATFLRFTSSQTTPEPKRYWDLPATPPHRRISVEEAAKELRHLLGEAVQRRLVADRPLGAFLSGGVDSTIITGLMAQQMPHRPVKTFSIGFEGDPRFNETRYAQVAAKRFRSEHTVFIVKPQPFDLLERLVWHHDQPFGDSSAMPTYLLCELARSQVTVALNGDGGDELFAGYDRFSASVLSEQMPQWVRWLGFQVFERLPARFDNRSLLGRIRRFFHVSQGPLAHRFFHWTSFFSHPGEFLRNGDPQAFLDTYARYLEPLSDASLLSRLLLLNFHEYLPNDLNVKMDRCSMAHGLEARSPFLDTALIEWAFRLPDALKLRGGTTKWIARRAFRHLLPPAIQRRRKMGFGVPLGTWLRTRWREPLQDHLDSPRSRIARYLHPDRVHQLVQSHLEGVQDVGHPLWLLLTLEVWLRQMERPISSPSRVAMHPR